MTDHQHPGALPGAFGQPFQAHRRRPDRGYWSAHRAARRRPAPADRPTARGTATGRRTAGRAAARRELSGGGSPSTAPVSASSSWPLKGSPSTSGVCCCCSERRRPAGLSTRPEKSAPNRSAPPAGWICHNRWARRYRALHRLTAAARPGRPPAGHNQRPAHRPRAAQTHSPLQAFEQTTQRIVIERKEVLGFRRTADGGQAA